MCKRANQVETNVRTLQVCKPWIMNVFLARGGVLLTCIPDAVTHLTCFCLGTLDRTCLSVGQLGRGGIVLVEWIGEGASSGPDTR
jgi:hypothetical protein